MDKISFFRADYRDGRVHIGGKSYPAGNFAVHLLNQFYENDTAARIGVWSVMPLIFTTKTIWMRTADQYESLSPKKHLLI